MSHDLHEIRAERKDRHPDNKGVVPGNIEALPAPEDADSYVMIKKKEEPKREQKQENGQQDQQQQQK